MFSKLLAKKVSLQEKHLTYDIDHIITNITNMFLALNTKLKKKYMFLTSFMTFFMHHNSITQFVITSIITYTTRTKSFRWWRV